MIVFSFKPCSDLLDIEIPSPSIHSMRLLNISAHTISHIQLQPSTLSFWFLRPDITGIQACRRIKAIERLRDIPIIMISVQPDPVNLQLAFAEGAVDYIRKPLIKAELIARVRSILKLGQEIWQRKAREQELIEVMQELESANRRLEQMSSLDGLTEIPNRRRFDEFFQQEWKRAVREAIPFSLILFDIDFSRPSMIPTATSPEMNV